MLKFQHTGSKASASFTAGVLLGYQTIVLFVILLKMVGFIPLSFAALTEILGIGESYS